MMDICFSLMLFLGWFQGSIEVVPVNDSTAHVSQGASITAKRAGLSIIFEEDFEAPLSGWTFESGEDDTTPESSGFQQRLNAPVAAHSGRGFVEVRGFEDDPNQCVPKHKRLVSPNIDTNGFEQVILVFFERIIVNGGTLPLYVMKSRMITDEERGNFGITELKFNYRSFENNCDVRQFDDIKVYGINGDFPDTRILEPEPFDGVSNVELGERLNFFADDGDGNTQGLSFTWRILVGRGGNGNLTLTGNPVEILFPEEGTYTVLCTAAFVDGVEDPTPAVRFFRAVPSRGLDTIIDIPRELVTPIAPGRSVVFRASSPGDQPGLSFLWRRVAQTANQEAEIKMGAEVEFTFNQTGLYTVSCAAQDATGFLDPSPDTRIVAVFGGHVTIVEPVPENGLRELLVAPGEKVLFKGSLDLPEEVAQQGFFWELEPGRRVLCENMENCEISFEEPGDYGVSLVAKGLPGGIGRDFLRVFVGPPLHLNIINPARRAEFAINQPFVLEGAVSGELSDQVEVFWIAEGLVFPGLRVEIPGVPRAGFYQARLVAIHRDSHKAVERRVNILIYDPANPRRPEITRPKMDQVVPPGFAVFFDSSLRGARGVDGRPAWAILRVSEDGGEEVIATSDRATLGRFRFEEEGNYLVQLLLRNDRGDLVLDSRTIQVKTTDQAAFGENLDLDRAAMLSSGRYEALDLNEARYFRFTVPAQGVWKLSLESGGPAEIIVFDDSGEPLYRKMVNGKTSILLADLAAGEYRWAVVPQDIGSKRGLNFSFGIDVVNPSLYFTDISENAFYSTDIGVINPNGEAADIEFIAYDADGNILEKQSRALEPLGSYKDAVTQLFDVDAGSIAWVRVDSTHQLNGYSHTVSINELEAYSINGAKYLLPELQVPHIAVNTGVWYTRSNLINGSEEEAKPSFKTSRVTEELNNQKSYTKDSFDFIETLGGSIPADASWGTFLDEEGNASLAGNEVFGKLDENVNQIASLGLAPAPQDNPNITSSTNTLYFTHIARNIDRFWTGLALVNLDDAVQGARIRAYGSGGVLINEKTLELPGREKLVELADTFLEGIGSPADVDWVEVEADSSIVGFELFGTHDNKQMAGLEAITEISRELSFPFVDVTGESWHGFALVNVSRQPANVSLTLYNSVGQPAAAAVDLSLAAKEKRIFLLTDLFPDIPLDGSWLRAVSDQEMAGFELFGNRNFEHMSGIIAQ